MPNAPKTPDALTSKILCRKHNSWLGPLDEEAGKLANWLVSTQYPYPTPTTTLELSGDKIERWVLKTAINSVASGWAHENKWRPGDQVVRTIFGLEPIPARCGLFVVDFSRDLADRPMELGFTPVWLNQENAAPILAGSFVMLNGLVFLFVLSPEVLDALRIFPFDVFGQQAAGLNFSYHPTDIYSPNGGLRIKIQW